MNASSDFSPLFPILIALSSTVLMVVMTFFILKWAQRTLMKKLIPLQQMLGGEIVGSLFKGTHLRLDQNGIEVRVGIAMGGKNTPPMMTLQAMTPLAFHLGVFTENFITKGLNKLVGLRDLKIGIPPFDDRFLVRTGDETGASGYLISNNRYLSIERFFDWGFTSFSGSGRAVFVSKPNYSMRDLEPTQVQLYLDELKNLVP